MDEYGDLNLTNGYDEMFLGNLFFFIHFYFKVRVKVLIHSSIIS